MEYSQKYIGSPCGLVICADHKEGESFSGRFYHFYSRTAEDFQSLEGLLLRMESFFDRINFPRLSNRRRSFAGNTPEEYIREERRKVMDEAELLKKHGDLGTFIVRVQHRQNSSWQGRITWCERNTTVNFRSVWEMVRLMEDALEMVAGPENMEGTVHWPEEDANDANED